MNLLPRRHNEFAKEMYWEEFFSKIQSKSFEWYGDYDSLCDILHKYIRENEKLLMIGCGNSELSANLYNVGFSNITNIDISATVIKQMQDKYKKLCPLMLFEKMDVFQMNFDNESFNVVLDKGTLDAVMVDVTKDTIRKVDRMFSEISRVLKFCGRYICISLLQEHILQKILDWFTKEGWMIRIHRCLKAEKKHDNSSLTFPVFVGIFTKMKKIPGTSPILELALEPDDGNKRVTSIKDVIEPINSIQYFAFLKHYISQKKLIDSNVCVELCCSLTGKIKYRLFIVDLARPATVTFAVFIVPQGRETEWLFATPEGRQQCAASANCERLIVVHLTRDFEFEDMDEVKRDLSANIMDLAPISLNSQVPFLSLGDDVGCRDVRANGKSDISGEYIVEDVESGNKQFCRRLIFTSNPYLVQSEAKLIKVSSKRRRKKSSDWQVDFDYLSCDHHAAMITGLAMLDPEIECPQILQIGLGGGGLAMFLRKHFRNAKIDVVELDPEVVNIAKDWFGVETDDHISIHIADGIAFMEEALEKGHHYNAIMIDVDSKDHSCGMSCPPQAFVNSPALNVMSKLVSPEGIVILNLVCRNTALHTAVYGKICSSFPSILRKEIPNEVNDVLFCMPVAKSQNFLCELKERSSEFSSHLKNSHNSDSCFDLSEILHSLEYVT